MAPLCCVPHDIVHCIIPEILDTKSAVQVLCSNPLCWQSGLVHPGCFYKWEDTLVRFLASGDRRGSSTDTQVMDSLWTKQMWDLPLPVNFTSCRCGLGSLKRNFEDADTVKSEVFKHVKGSTLETVVKVDSRGDLKQRKLGEECIEKIESSEDPVDESWDIVCRSKSKKKLNISKATNKNKVKLSLKKQHFAATPKPGPDPQLSEAAYVPPLHHSSQAEPLPLPEGKRDSSGLIHCCSCHTVHASLPDFIQHCKSVQHDKLQESTVAETGEEDINNNVEDENDNKQEMEQLRRCLLELMKQGLERDRLAAQDFDAVKEKCIFELKKNSGALALLIEKLQQMEDNFSGLNEKLTSLTLKVEESEKDLDICYDYCDDFAGKISGLSKDFKGFQKKNMMATEVHNVKFSEIQSRCNDIIQDVGHTEPQSQNGEILRKFAIVGIVLCGVLAFFSLVM